MSRKSIDVAQAFDPDARLAQAEFDAYLASRPSREGDPDVASATLNEQPHATVSKTIGASALSGGVITGSFERPVIEVRQYTKLDRIGMLLDDVRDNIDHKAPPYTAEYSGPEAGLLRNRLLPEEAVRAVRRLGMHYPAGSVNRCIIHVGDQDAGTFHPHYYFMDRTHHGRTRMYFVDPEHKVAKDNLFRPSIVNLVGVEVPDEESDDSSVVGILRYRVPVYDHKQKPTGLRPDELRSVIAQVLDTESVPDVLSAEAQRQLLFMIVAGGENSKVQGRYSSKAQIESFAKGGKGSSALEGKVHVQSYVLNKLITLFNKPSQARKV